MNQITLFRKKFKLIYRSDFIEKIIDTMKEMLEFYRQLEMDIPIIVSCAIMNGNEYTIPMNECTDTYGVIDRDVLLIPSVLIDDITIDEAKCLQPVFDSIWNAFEYIECPAYNKDGEYIGIK